MLETKFLDFKVKLPISNALINCRLALMLKFQRTSDFIYLIGIEPVIMIHLAGLTRDLLNQIFI